MLRHALLTLFLATAPAMAQDLASQYAAAARAFTLPGAPSLGQADLLADAAVMALLPGLQGDWAPAGVLFTDPAGLDPAILRQACERTPSALVQTAPRSFELRRTSGRDGQAVTMAIRHDWIIGNTFDRSVDENEAMAYLGLDGLDEIRPGMLALPGLRGQVSLFNPSPDILVLVAPGGPPEILARCPA
ncbi:hypothetical protein Rumeso_00377 [Rubellimicrobium mesophilum DSM 19309]|uniref:Uncharacterized protein n=1 Tax=Rubellimicrobium mesophilum DSM 19309 TaxID=442562 RepID=A0A017HUS1_9RHOB|nr:hypothetical protein [Rubellimicrobium mesophilum]EYD78040.1 hypothetical protein Rumeso_00377 [Rubellimicrobium mesophilum DSM 19309]